MPDRKKHILLVSYLAPPAGGPRSTRVAQVAKFLVAAGHSVTILAADTGGGEALLMQKIGGAALCKTYAGPLAARLAARSRAAAQAPAARTPGRAERLIKRWLVPDRQLEWLPFALAAGARVTRPDLVLSFSPYYTSHLAGHALAARHRAPHVMDYGDPWSDRAFELAPAARAADRRLERAVVTRARAVIVNTAPMAESLRARFGHARVVNIPNAYDAGDFGPPPAAGNGELTYVGNLYEARVGLAAIGAAVAASPFAKLVVYGTLHNQDVPPWMAYRGRVSYAESLRVMQRAGALLLIGNQGARQIPAKTYHYLGAGRPVVAVVESMADPLAGLREPGRFSVAVNEAAAIAAGLAAAAAAAGQRFAPAPEASWQARAAVYLPLLEELAC